MLTLDPNATGTYSLPGDEGKPVNVRPTFIVKPLTCRAALDYSRQLEAIKADTAEGAMAAVWTLMTTTGGLVGWRNVPRTFGLDGAMDVLTVREFWQLAFGLPHASELTEGDRGNSGSQSASASASTAPAAGKVDA